MKNIQVEIIDKRDLTDREADVLRLLVIGAPDKTIARVLAISIKTVGHHLDHIYTKLQLSNASVNARCATISIAVARGMVRISGVLLCMWLMVWTVLNDDYLAKVRPLNVASVARVSGRRYE